MQKHSLHADEWPEIAAKKYMDMVYRLAYVKTGSREDAEDVTQNVFLHLVRYKPVFESETHLKHWLIRVTANESVNLFRSAWRRLTLPLEDVAMGDAPRNENHDELEEALSLLAPKCRVVIHLFYYEDMPAKEIAEALGIRPEAVRERLHRARKKLKQQLIGKGEDEFV